MINITVIIIINAVLFILQTLICDFLFTLAFVLDYKHFSLMIKHLIIKDCHLQTNFIIWCLFFISSLFLFDKLYL